MTDTVSESIDLGRLAIIAESCATPDNGLTVEVVAVDQVGGLTEQSPAWELRAGEACVVIVEIRSIEEIAAGVIGHFAAALQTNADSTTVDLSTVPSSVLAIGDAGGTALVAFVAPGTGFVERRVNAEDPSGGLLSLGMLREVPLEVSAELGRTRLSVAEILQLTVGSVIELDRTAGAPVDVMVNGSLIARGEVVVIDDEYGIRITEIVGRIGDAI